MGRTAEEAMKMSVGRRKFVGLGASFAVAGCRSWSDGVPAIVRGRNLNSRLAHACIGTGGKGQSDWMNFMSHPKVDLVAACDVDTARMAAIRKAVPGIRLYQDWRELLEKEKGRIDSVNVSTPDHMHTLIVTHAMRNGLHVYCQKPLCRGLNECRLLREVAERSGVVTEIGAQVTGDGGDRTAVAWLKSGVIGDLENVYMFLNIKGTYRLPRCAVPEGSDPVPATLDWDRWLGTAPARPYRSGIYHPGHWRKWRDFGSSSMGDNGFHLMSAVWLGFDFGGDLAPISATGEADPLWQGFDPLRRQQIWPVGNHVSWRFPGVKASGGKPFSMEWFDGIPEENPPAKMLPPAEVVAVAQRMRMKSTPVIGKMIKGSQGWMMLSHGGMPVVLLNDGSRPKPPRLPRGQGHYHDFLNHCLDGTRGALDFVRRGVAMQEALLLGNAAQVVPGVPLRWDAARHVVANSDEATRVLYPAYRDGWKLEGLAEI